MTEQEALERFASGDEASAQDAFGFLWEKGRRFLHAYLGPTLRSEQDREDVIQEVAGKIWGFRSRFHNQGPGAWCVFLKRIAERCRADQHRATGNEIPIAEMDEEADGCDTASELISSLSVALEAGLLYETVNVVLLGLDPSFSPAAHRRRLLCAQLFYIDGVDQETIRRLVSATEPQLSRSELDTWLSDSGVLRHLAYQQVYLSNEELAGCLTRSGNWTEPEAQVLAWRYRYGMLADQVQQREDCPLEEKELCELLVRLECLFPFADRMTELLSRVRDRWSPKAQTAFETPELWQRLAFQYRYHDELAHKDISSRIVPAAEVVGFKLTLGMLNVWLSNGRLLARVAKGCQTENEKRF